MANKYWSKENETYYLYFTQFYDPDLVAELYRDRFDDWNWLMRVDGYVVENWQSLDEGLTLDEAKEEVERMIVEYVNSEIEWYKDFVEKWEDE